MTTPNSTQTTHSSTLPSILQIPNLGPKLWTSGRICGDRWPPWWRRRASSSTLDSTANMAWECRRRRKWQLEFETAIFKCTSLLDFVFAFLCQRNLKRLHRPICMREQKRRVGSVWLLQQCYCTVFPKWAGINNVERVHSAKWSGRDCLHWRPCHRTGCWCRHHKRWVVYLSGWKQSNQPVPGGW